MEHKKIASKDLLELIIEGRFTFADNKIFSSVLDSIETQEYKKLIIDLEMVDFIDSAALGILLLARDKCEKSSVGLVIRNPKGQVKQMFKISKLNELFNIEEKVANS